MALTRSRLEQMNEDRLRKEVLIPLFREMGYREVVEHHGGVLEQGKDIVMWKAGDFERRVNYSVVVKSKKISGKAAGKGSAAEAVMQIQQSFGSPFKDHLTGTDQVVHQCYVVCPVITKEALNSMKGAMEDYLLRDTTFLHGDTLWSTIEKYLPEKTVVEKLKQAQQVLGNVSDEFRVNVNVGDDLQFTIQGKDSENGRIQPIEISGKFEFPDTPEGREAAEAVEKAFRTGSPASIPQEFVKEFQVPSEIRSLFGLDESSLPAIEMRSAPPQTPLLIRLEVQRDGETAGVFEYVELRATQIGSDEVTLSNKAQPVPLKLQIVINRQTEEMRQTWTIETKDQNPHEVLKALRFHNEVVAGGTLRSIHVQTGFLISERDVEPGQGGIESAEPGWLDVLEALDHIQQRIRIPFQLPESGISLEEAHEILETSKIIREGRLNLTSAGWKIGVEKLSLDEHFRNFPPGSPHHMAFKQQEEREIVGVRFSMGDRIVSCANAYTSKSEAKRVNVSASNLGENDIVHINVKPFDECPVIVEYPKWLPAGAKLAYDFQETDCKNPNTSTDREEETK